jgi:hypothetical protein
MTYNATFTVRSPRGVQVGFDGDIVGCGALVQADDGTAEIKRMFVDPRCAAGKSPGG